MAFPTNPTNGQTFTENAVDYTFDSTLGVWKKVKAAAGTVTTGNVPVTRTINTSFSITGGGDLTTNRTLSLVNDQANPGPSKYYGTDSSGVKGWYPTFSLQPLSAISGVNQNRPVNPGEYYYFLSNYTSGSISQYFTSGASASGYKLLANRLYAFNVTAYGGTYKWAVVDRDANTVINSFQSTTSFVYAPTTDVMIGVRNEDTVISTASVSITIHSLD